MNGKHAFLIFLILGILAGLLYFFYFYEKTTQDKASEVANISISAVDTKNVDRKIETGFRITGVNYSYSFQDNTLTGGNIMIQVPINHTYKIENVNINNQTYYTVSDMFLNASEIKQYQVKLFLIKAGSVIISSSDVLGNSNNLSLNLKFRGYYQEPILCLRWGMHIIKVEPIEYLEKVNKPNKYNRFDVCYDLNSSFINAQKDILLKYSQIGELTERDYINITVIDSDLGVTEVDGKDVGGTNAIFSYTSI